MIAVDLNIWGSDLVPLVLGELMIDRSFRDGPCGTYIDSSVCIVLSNAMNCDKTVKVLRDGIITEVLLGLLQKT